MGLSEKVKAYFEGETRDLERKIAKLDGNIDHLVREQRLTRFASQTVAAFQVFNLVAPMVSSAFKAVTNAAIDSSIHVIAIRKEQAMLNDEWERTKSLIGGQLLGDMATLETRFAGIAGYLRDINESMRGGGGNLLSPKNAMLGAGAGALSGMLLGGRFGPPGLVGGGLIGAIGGGLSPLILDNFLEGLDKKGKEELQRQREFKAAFDEMMRGFGLVNVGQGGLRGRGIGAARPSIGNAALLEEESAFSITPQTVRRRPTPLTPGTRALNLVGGGVRLKDLGDGTKQVEELNTKIDQTAFSFSQAELAAAQWSVTIDGAMTVASSSLQAHLSEQLRFENLKKASGKRIVQSVLADVGSQALAEATFQTAMAVGYLFINPAQAAAHGRAAGMLWGVAALAGGAYRAAGGSFNQQGDANRRTRLEEEQAGRNRKAEEAADKTSARTVAAAAAPGVINFTLTFIYNSPVYYVGPGGLEEFVGEIVPALNSRIDSGELRVA